MEHLRARLDAIADEARDLTEQLDELYVTDDLTDEQRALVAELEGRGQELVDERTDLEARLEARAKLVKAAEKPQNVERATPEGRDPGDPYDLTGLRAFDPSLGRELKGRALKAIESTDSWEMEDRAKQRATELVERHDDARGTIAKMVLSTGFRAYKEAWTLAITGREMMLSAEQRQMLAYAQSVRAMTLGTTTEGGFAAPFPIDPSLIVTGDGSTNPFRQISRVVPITSDSWQGLSAGAVSASFDSEAAEVSDDAPTWAQPQVVAHMARAFIPASIEITLDYPGIANDLGLLFQIGKDDLETTAFSTGSGTGEPFGIVTAIDGTGNDVGTATTDVYAVADVRTVHNTVGPRYRSRGSWVMNNAIINSTVAFGTDALATQTVSLADGTAGLSVLGRPVYESSGMDGVINAGAENNIVVFGDFSHYLIADRVGFTVEYIPHLFATANNLPSGQRGWFAYWRVGADSVNDDAFALLNAT